MEGLREQRSNSSNNQRDNLLDSLHECDAYKELSKKRKDLEDITSFEQIEPKKSSIDDISNFYSRLEEDFTWDLMEKYDKLMGDAFLAYGMDREFIFNHYYDIRCTPKQSKDDNYEKIVIEFVPLSVKLFAIDSAYKFRYLSRNSFNHSDTVHIEGYLQVFMEHEGAELEEIKKYIQDYYQEKEN